MTILLSEFSALAMFKEALFPNVAIASEVGKNTKTSKMTSLSEELSVNDIPNECPKRKVQHRRRKVKNSKV